MRVTLHPAGALIVESSFAVLPLLPKPRSVYTVTMA